MYQKFFSLSVSFFTWLYNRPAFYKRRRNTNDKLVAITLYQPMTWIFIADAPLGKLSKWLRIIGYESYYCPHLFPHNIVYPVQIDSRAIILTRQRRLYEKLNLTSPPHRTLFIVDDHWKNQLIQVIRELNLKKPQKPFTRCIRCGIVLKEIEKSKVITLVPAYIYESRDHFCHCLQCSRIYWQGTHFSKMAHEIEQIFDLAQR